MLLLGLAGCGPRGAVAPAVCPATGPVMIRGPEDVAALAGCARVPGLEVRTAMTVELSPLTGLTAIDGDLVIGPTLAIPTLSLPAVTEITGRLRVGGSGDLTGLFLPALIHAGAVDLSDDPSLMSLSLPALTAIHGPLTLTRLPALELIDTAALVEVGGVLTLTAVPALTTWIGPPATVGGARTIDAPRLDPDVRAQLDHGP